MTRPSAAGENSSGADPAPSASELPPRYSPRVAGQARGPWIEPRLVTPTDLKWRDARTYVVLDYRAVGWRCVRVTGPGGHHAGYWAIERLGLSLMGPEVWSYWDAIGGPDADTI